MLNIKRRRVPHLNGNSGSCLSNNNNNIDNKNINNNYSNNNNNNNANIQNNNLKHSNFYKTVEHFCLQHKNCNGLTSEVCVRVCYTFYFLQIYFYLQTYKNRFPSNDNRFMHFCNQVTFGLSMN